MRENFYINVRVSRDKLRKFSNGSFSLFVACEARDAIPQIAFEKKSSHINTSVPYKVINKTHFSWGNFWYLKLYVYLLCLETSKFLIYSFDVKMLTERKFFTPLKNTLYIHFHSFLSTYIPLDMDWKKLLIFIDISLTS